VYWSSGGAVFDPANYWIGSSVSWGGGGHGGADCRLSNRRHCGRRLSSEELVEGSPVGVVLVSHSIFDCMYCDFIFIFSVTVVMVSVLMGSSSTDMVCFQYICDKLLLFMLYMLA
jgi:hypothetical protein